MARRRDTPPYYRVRNGNAFFQPTPKMRAAGFEARPLGPDGPGAKRRCWQLYYDWQEYRQGRTVPSEHTYPPASCGEAWERYRRTPVWTAKAKATRDEWEHVWLHCIKDVFGDVDLRTVRLEDIAGLREHVLSTASPHAAHRLLKIWRAFWKVAASMGYCERDADPSMAIRNTAPKGRSATWSEGEVARLGKAAWRNGYKGLAAVIAVAYDTGFQPGDIRSLTATQLLRDAQGAYFDQSRGKTGRATIGTLSRRTERVLEAYRAALPFQVHGDAQLFRNRSGLPYSKDTLGDDFRTIRKLVFPGDQRRLMDMRRTGAVEATAGEVTAETLSAKMGNSISQSKRLQDTYLPKRAATVRLADAARTRGRRRLRKNET